MVKKGLLFLMEGSVVIQIVYYLTDPADVQGHAHARGTGGEGARTAEAGTLDH